MFVVRRSRLNPVPSIKGVLVDIDRYKRYRVRMLIRGTVLIDQILHYLQLLYLRPGRISSSTSLLSSVDTSTRRHAWGLRWAHKSTPPMKSLDCVSFAMVSCFVGSYELLVLGSFWAWCLIQKTGDSKLLGYKQSRCVLQLRYTICATDQWELKIYSSSPNHLA
jgi:hypothetical protein